MRITVISDTHTKHNQITSSLPGGDLLIHTGDIMNSGYHANDIYSFCEWFNGIDNYHHKVFIAGNHDRMFEDHPEKVMEILNSYKTIDYLQDDWIKVSDVDKMVKIYGSPWQPEFYSWAFNLPRQGEELKSKWDMIPMNTDILLTHGPAWGHLDTVAGQSVPLGCELLSERIKVVKPKIHVCGHIHTGYGYKFEDGTHFFNASVLDERYIFTHPPMTFDWNRETNEVTFI
jgi:Icc-related predicted phosphoesterase